MCSCKDSTKQNAETAHDNICNAEEGVFATHNGSGGDQNGFGAAVQFHVKPYIEVSYEIVVISRSRDSLS